MGKKMITILRKKIAELALYQPSKLVYVSTKLMNYVVVLLDFVFLNVCRSYLHMDESFQDYS